MKYYGPYTMTKHALEALVVALDGEIRPHGARAAIVQPGGVITAIGDNSLAADRDRFRRAPPPFDLEAREIAESLDAPGPAFDPGQPESAANRNPCPPETVADAILKLLESRDPPLRTLVGTRWEGDRVLRALMERIADANRCSALSYSREELTKKLGEIVSRAARIE